MQSAMCPKRVPNPKHNLKNLNRKLKTSGLSVKIAKNATVYDKSAGQSTPFALLFKGQTNPVLDHEGSRPVSGKAKHLRIQTGNGEKGVMIDSTHPPYTIHWAKERLKT